MHKAFTDLPQRELARLVDLLVRDSCDHAVFEIDTGGTILRVSESFYRLFNTDSSHVIGRSLTDFYPTGYQSPERMTTLIADAVAAGIAREEDSYQRSNGQVFYGKTTIFAIEKTHPPQFVVTVRDMTLLVASQEQLHIMMTIDDVTQLNNRQHLFELGRVEYRRWARYGAPMSLVLLEINHDNPSEAMLRDMADILRQCLREVDIAARIYKGIFCILMFNTPLEGACIVAERIRNAVNMTALQQAHQTKMFLNQVVLTADANVGDFDGLYHKGFSVLQDLNRQGNDHLLVL